MNGFTTHSTFKVVTPGTILDGTIVVGNVSVFHKFLTMSKHFFKNIYFNERLKLLSPIEGHSFREN